MLLLEVGGAVMTSSLMTDCIYLPNKPEKNGYVRRGRGPERSAHRQAYVEAYGPIPEGFTVDHEGHNRDTLCPGGVCKHRACVNPQHLIAVPSRVNTLASTNTSASLNLAKEKCPEGHPYTGLNLYLWGGKRYCRMCKLIDDQRRHREQKAQEWGLLADD